MTEELIKQCATDNQPFIQIDSLWVPVFFYRHRYLKTKMTHAIETTHIKDVTKEQILHFNKELRHVIQKHKIPLENIFKMDETGFPQFDYLLIIESSIDTMQTSNVVIDTSVSNAYEAQPSR